MHSKTAFTLWFTGLPCSGKSTLSALVASHLRQRGLAVELLDGDAIRRDLWPELGFSDSDRLMNIRRLGRVAELLTRNGVVTVVAAVSPLRSARQEVRELLPTFVEVHVECPAEVCQQRDVKGMYEKARRGLISNFTGLDGAYEAPLDPEVVVHTAEHGPEQCVATILSALEQAKLV